MGNVVTLRDGDTKKCSVCGEQKPIGQFSWKAKSKSGISPACTDCNRARDRERYRNQMARRKETSKWAMIKFNFGLTKEAWYAILEAQKFQCAICEGAFVTEGRSAFNPCVDHDHDLNKVRGFLCRKCNQGIGLLRDRSSIAEKAAAYLKRHGK
jgi:hypothetical protein